MHFWVTDWQRMLLKVVIYMSYYLKFFLNFANLNSRFFDWKSMTSDCFLGILFLYRLNIQLVSSIWFDMIYHWPCDLLIIINGSQLWGLSTASSWMKNIFSLALRRFCESIFIKFNFSTVRFDKLCRRSKNFGNFICNKGIGRLYFERFLHYRCQIVAVLEYFGLFSRTILLNYPSLITFIFHCTWLCSTLKNLTASWKLATCSRSKVFSYCSSSNPLISHCHQWLMDWSSLCENTSKRYRHLHTSINTFGSLLNLRNIRIILRYAWGPLMNLLRTFLWWRWIYSGRLSSNNHIIRFGGDFACFWNRSYIYLRPSLKVSKGHSSIISFKGIVDYLILY